MSRRLRAAKWLVVVTALAGASARPAQAQNTAVIEGTVADEQGAVMPGVTMTLRNIETGVERTMTTEGAGTYRFPALQPGTYSLTATLQGFASAQLRDIALTIGLNLRYDITLKLQALAETVTVTAEAPVVDVTKSEVAGVVTQKQIETLPINTRQYLNLALLMPGTSQDSVRVFYNNVNVGAGGSFYSKPIRLAGAPGGGCRAGIQPVHTVNLSGLGTNALAATFGVASRASAGRQAEAAVRFVW